MKKVISLLLVLTLILSLSCAAFATSSPGQGGDAPVTPGTGDPSNVTLWIVLLVLAVIAIAVLTVVYNKFLKRS